MPERHRLERRGPEGQRPIGNTILEKSQQEAS